ncbi:MAG TPA: GGDEF domain-containing protein [Thermoanaerobaculia bacterium]|nr:GGDEF domain-containing protein [Thermoanaerobaculia bacterium]
MDSRTVYVLSCICLAATAMLVALAALSYPPPLRRNGFQWAGAVALLAAGMGFIAVRGNVPDVVSVLGAHASSVAGLGAFYYSLQRFQGRRPRLLWTYLPLPLAVASASYFYFVVPDYGMRVAVFSAITALQMALCAGVLAPGGGPAPRTARLVAVGFAACSALLLVRTVASLRVTAAATPGAIFRASLLEQGIIVGVFIGFFALSLSFVILCNESLNRELARQATTDSLTGCLNRRTLEELAEREAARARRHDRLLSIALIDLDHLKAINDEHGHAAGDAALRHVGRAFAQTVRSQDLFGRYGGDEFLLVMPETGKADAVAACERVCRAVKSAIVEQDGVQLPITVSVGVATSRGGGVEVAGLLGAADAALYAVKAGGRNSVRVAAAV